ncbi:hypothetical protein [Marinicrinis lubricantis]|uniref:Uncharacterized protein n=1 Tax=Marinicrinis lubricantis TaxID=2086470 RepID=A0ABW1IJS7_9BACL
MFEQMEQPGDSAELKEKLISLSEMYAGATGWMVLDEKGDRKYSLYDIWQLQNVSASFEWSRIGE